MTVDGKQLKVMQEYVVETMKNTVSAQDLAEIVTGRKWTLEELEVLHNAVKKKLCENA